MMVKFSSLFSQEERKVIDTLLVQKDSVITDTILTNIRHPSANAIDSKVTYSAAGYKKSDLINKRVILIQKAIVNYETMVIKADSIVFNMGTNLLFAAGRKDTTGKIVGTPVFKDGKEEFEAKELTYNFKTHKAYIINIVTKQEDGFLHSEFTKLLEDKTSNIEKSTYSTCDADTPHFYINLPRAKVYPGKKIVSGPGNLVVEGIPLPLFIPFAYIPIQTKRAASGILMPQIGQEAQRGYNLTDGGYYFAISDYFDLALKGNIYSNGTWMLTAQSDYKRLYNYNGNFLFSYANNVTGHQGLSDYSETTNYKLAWNYNQDAKASPGSIFSASINMSSSGYDQLNSYVVAEHVATSRQSAVSYSKSWDGTPFNLSVSTNQSQNVEDHKVFLDLPKANFNMSRIYPLKDNNSSGTTKWYQELQFSYSASLDNKINTYDSLLFTRKIWKNMNNGFTQTAPLSILIRPFNNFSISPALTYTGVMYTQKIIERWDPNYIDKSTNQRKPQIVDDTLRGVFYGQAVNPSVNISFNPQIFGTYLFTNPDSRFQAIRHVINPSISFSFIPAFAGLSSKMYRQVQVDSTAKNFSKYSVFANNIFGTPSLSSKSGNISLSLVNIVEAKIFAKDDTTGKAKKVKILDNFSISTSYNVFADSIRWAPITMQMRTSLFNNINIFAKSSFSLYGTNSAGQDIGTFLYTQDKKLMRLTQFTTSLDFSLSELLKKDKDKKKTDANAVVPQNTLTPGQQANNITPGSNNLTAQNSTGANKDQYGYTNFNVPWTLNFSYSFNYYVEGLKPVISQTLSFNGNLSLTKKMAITYTSGYDFKGKQITMTQIGITRDLHCWEMTFNWVPNGSMQMWNFTIRVKASSLGDLKYDRRKDFHDSY